MKTDRPAYVIYHKDCFDGFGAAWVARRALRDSHGEIRYLPLESAAPLPLAEIPDGAFVYIFDLTPARAQLEQLHERAGYLLVLDHHETGRRRLGGLEYVELSQDRSAAVMAWNTFYGSSCPPRLLLAIQDWDLWRFAIPETKPIHHYLLSQPLDFEVWDGIERALRYNDSRKLVQSGGRAIMRFIRRAAEQVAESAHPAMLDGRIAPYANVAAQSIKAAVHEVLAERFPLAEFTVTYHERASDGRRWSLRSTGKFNVAEIAGKYGGGGHAGAAGFIQEYGDKWPLGDIR